jgi:hypothetical protein
MSVTAIVYRPEMLPEVAAAVTIQLAQFYVMPLAARSFAQLEEQLKALVNKVAVLTVLGSYYTPEQLQGLQKMHNIGKVEVYVYASDAAARKLDPSAAALAPLMYCIIDDTKESYAAHAWRVAMGADKPAPVELQLIDLKGRNDLSSNLQTRPFCEWVQTQGASLALVRKLLEHGTPESLAEQVHAGHSYLEKTESVVAAIASAAGWYTCQIGTSGEKLRVAVVDSQRLIELVAENLCQETATHPRASLAVITRYDHVAGKSRYTFYTSLPAQQVNALELARDLGYDAGGSARMAGFVSDDSIPQFLVKLKQVQ